MSTYWDVHCLDCNEGLGLHGNHEESAANAIAADAGKLAAIAIPGLRIDLSEQPYGFYSETGALVNVDWFTKHRGHNIRAKNEYGNLSGACGARVPCKTCGVSGDCNLAPAHPGEHEPRRI